MIGDIASRVLVHYEIETKDFKRGLKDLDGEERKFAEGQAKRAEARNDQLDKWIKGLGTATIAIGAVAAAGAAMWSGMEHNARKAQLAQNVHIADLERLRKGFGGLRTEMQALEVANKLSHGTMRLTAGQMETVGAAMRQLVREGHSWEDVTTKVTDAFVKLNGSGLDDFNIHVREAKTDAEKFNVILEAMAAKAGKVGDGSKTSAEELQGLRVKFTDVMDSVKQSLGEIGVAFLPIVDALSKIAKLAGGLMNLLPGGSSTIGKIASKSYYAIPGIGQYLLYKDTLGADQKALNALHTGGRSIGGGAGSYFGDGFEIGSATATPVNRGPYTPATMPGFEYGDTVYGTGATSLGSAAGYGDPYGISASQLNPRGFDRGSMSGTNPFWMDEQTANYQYNAVQSSKLEAIFGSLTEFDAYKTAFETLNGAVGTAFSAWIDGSASAGQAFKKFIAEALKGLAVQMAMEAIKHGAYALGSLAFGNFAGAAAHGKAAAGFAAGAVAIGVAAKGLHSGGGSSSGASAPGGGVPAYSGGSQQSGGERVTVVAFGQDYSNDSARQRQLRAAKVLEDARQAQGHGGVSYA